MNIFGMAFTLFSWFFWITLLAVFVWFVFKLPERLKNNNLNTYYNISSADVAKNIKVEEERNSSEKINNHIQG